MNGDPKIERLVEVDSTNAELIRRLGNPDSPGEGHWIVADRQIAGRGRLGRAWQDGAGNFMGSTVIQPRSDGPPAQTLALVAGIAVHDCLSRLMSDPGGLMLKWPNDVLLHGAKLAGILLEAVGKVVVIGIGVNLAVAPDVPGRNVTSLSGQGAFVDRDRFACDLAAALADAVAMWRGAGLSYVIEKWSRLGPAIGAPISVTVSDRETLTGTFDGLDNSGALRIRLEDGMCRAIHAGEVSLIGADGPTDAKGV